MVYRTQRSPVPYPKVTTTIPGERTQNRAVLADVFIRLAGLFNPYSNVTGNLPVTNLRAARHREEWPAQVASSQVQFKKRSHPPNLKFLSSGTSGRGVLIVLGW